MENNEIMSMMDVVNYSFGKLEGHEERVFDAVADEIFDGEFDFHSSETKIGLKIATLAYKIGSYVIDHSDEFNDLLVAEFKDDVDEIDFLVNQENESEENKQD